MKATLLLGLVFHSAHALRAPSVDPSVLALRAAKIRPLEPTAKEADGEMFCFLVSQAPIQCVLRCKNEEERKKWLDALAERSDEWRQKRRGEMTNSGCARAPLLSPRSRAKRRCLLARSHARVFSLLCRSAV